MRMFRPLLAGAVLTALLLVASPGRADTFNGTLFYTNFNGGENVNSINYAYDSTTQAVALSGQHGIAALGGADGIIFDASGQHLLVGGQGTGNVYRLNEDGTGVSSALSGSGASYHLALDPNGSSVYTSNFGGALDVLPINSTTLSNGTSHTVTGGDPGVTQIAFANGQAYYDDSFPNGFGNFGTIDLNTYQTTRILTDQQSIHGMIFDPFTNKITFFGAGKVGTYDPTSGIFEQSGQINADFDQGAVDGHGHAFIAGNGEITFIDYSATGDITSSANVVRIISGFGGIDDLAPLVGPGSQAVPEPSAVALLATGGLSLFGFCWRRRRVA